MRLSIVPALAVLTLLAVALGIGAYMKDPSLPMIGVRNGVQMLWFVLPRMVPALIVTGLLQVVIRPIWWPVTSGARAGSRRSSSPPSSAC